MRVTAFSLILFYVCLNLSLYFVGETQVLPESAPPHSAPQKIYETLGSGVITVGIGMILTFLFENWIFGAAALGLWGLQFLLGTNNIIYWIFWGTPEFINRFAATTEMQSAQLTIFQNVVLGLTSVVWFWFIMGFVSQRVMES